ncbi:MAG: M81 family metallopeptidase [Geminicoccaceae bacterium]|nr:M81 family metallopeptidase [Geminicoccaceae bacterium]MDW8370296.1 M81 family metallopeptidase [Geminicoccaceae bacterium]
MRLGLVHLAQETNSFNPEPTALADFAAYGLYEGPEIPARLAGVGEVGGFLEVVAGEADIVPVPILRAYAAAGGPVAADALAWFEERLRAGLAAAEPLDGLALQLHGACAAPGEPDVDGRIASLCRAILGPEVPIVLSLDHHAHLTARMVDTVDAIVAHRTQPHDLLDTGRVATRLLLRLVRERLRPVIAHVRLPLLAHQEQFLTDRGPMKVWFDRARALEREPGVLAIATFPVQPWLDVPGLGWAVAVTTAGDRDLARRLAEELAELAWSLRHEFQKRDSLPLAEALDRAAGAPAGLVVLSDTGDTVIGGAAGDSPVLLEAISARGLGPALVPIVAPEAVAAAHAAGEGALLGLELGGELTGFFRPLPVEARVRRLGAGPLRLPFHWASEVDHGRVALLEIGPAFVLASERRGVGGIVPELWRAYGIEPAEARLVVVKTASNFQYFRPLAVALLRVDTPGPATSHLETLPWRHLTRPIFPLDPIEQWRSRASCAC